MLMTAADYRDSLRAYKPRVFVNGKAIESVADEPLLAPGIAGVGVTYDFAHAEAAFAGHDGAPGHVGQDRQPHAPHQREFDGPALQARGGPSGLPDVRLRAALSDARCAERHLPVHQADRRSSRHRLQPALSRSYLHDIQDRDLTLGVAMTDAKGDRSMRPGPAGQPGRLRPHQGAEAGRHRHPRHQGDRHRRALYARVPGDALPNPRSGGQGFRRVLRGPRRRARRHHRRAPRGPARRGLRQVLGQIRPVRRRRDLRRRIRAARSGLPGRRNRRGRLPDHVVTRRTIGIPASVRARVSAIS